MFILFLVHLQFSVGSEPYIFPMYDTFIVRACNRFLMSCWSDDLIIMVEVLGYRLYAMERAWEECLFVNLDFVHDHCLEDEIFPLLYRVVRVTLMTCSHIEIFNPHIFRWGNVMVWYVHAWHVHCGRSSSVKIPLVQSVGEWLVNSFAAPITHNRVD